jgi:hypothetical protein
MVCLNKCVRRAVEAPGVNHIVRGAGIAATTNPNPDEDSVQEFSVGHARRRPFLT